MGLSKNGTGTVEKAAYGKTCIGETGPEGVLGSWEKGVQNKQGATPVRSRMQK